MAFWKSREADDYESLTMESADGRTFIGRLDPKIPASPQLTYYLVYKTEGRIAYLPDDAPGRLYSVSLPASAAEGIAPAQEVSAAPDAPSEPRPLRLRLDGTVDAAVVKGETETGTQAWNSQNARLEYAGRAGQVEVTVGLRAAYTNRPYEGENNFDLPELNLSAKTGGHSLRLGDLSLSESELSIASSGRRGLAYGFQSGIFEIRAFTQSTQTLRGFKGLGWPKSGAMLFGGAVAVSPFKGFSLKAVSVSGEDDPALGFNVGPSPLYRRRKGRVLSFLGETVLLQEALRFQAEFALSNFDADLGDGEALVAGRAFRAEGRFRKGVFDAQIGYRSLDKNFNSVGLTYLLNDRRGFHGAAGLTFGRFRLGGSFRNEETNVAGDPDLAVAGLTSGQGDVTYAFGSSSVRFGLTRELQNASFSSGLWNPYPAFQGDLLKTGITGGVDLGFKSWLRLSLAGEHSTLKCDLTPAMNGGQTSASIGLQLFIPERIMLFPCFSYSRIEPSAGAATRSMTAAVNGELTLIRKWLTWNVTAVLGDFAQGLGDPVKSLSADTGINLHLRPLLTFADVLLSIRGQYLRTRGTGAAVDDFRATVRLTHAF